MAGGYTVPPADEIAELRKILLAHETRLAELERPTGTQLFESVASLEATIANLQTTTNELSDTVDYLDSLGGVQSFGSTSYTSVAANTWATSNCPSVTLTTPSGGLLVVVSALIAGDAGSFMTATFSISGHVNRDTQISAITATSPALSGNANCLAVLETANVGSYVQYVSGLPTDTPVTVQFEAKPWPSFGAFTGARITAIVI